MAPANTLRRTLNLNDTSARPAAIGQTPSGNNGGSGSGSSGLSTGAQAGIGVGCAIAGLLILAAIFVYARRRKRSKGRVELPELPEDQKASPIQAVNTTQSSPHHQHRQPPAYEMDVKDRPMAEMQG